MSPTGTTTSLRVTSNDSIDDVKRMLQSQEGFLSDHVELQFDGEIMLGNYTVADYSLQKESLISFSLRHIVNETGASFEAINGEKESFLNSTSTLVGIGVLLVVILITVPLVVYRTLRKRNAGREQLMDVYAAAYQKDGYNGPGKPFVRYPSSQHSESVASEATSRAVSSKDPKTFFDLVFDRFDLDPVIFTDESVGANSKETPAREDDNIYESAQTLRKEAKLAKKGSFTLTRFGGGESDTDTDVGGNIGRKGIFRFRMTSEGNEQHEDTEDEHMKTKNMKKKKKKKKKVKKKQEMNIGKRVLQPQWFHGDTARPAASSTDQLQYDDSEMFVTTKPASRKQSRLVDKQSTGYSEILKTPNPPPRRKMNERHMLAHAPPSYFRDGGYAEARGINQQQRERAMSPEGFEDLPPVRGLPSGFSQDDLLDQDDLLLFEGGYIETDASRGPRNGGSSARVRTAARKANGTVGEYIDTNSSPTGRHGGDLGYIDGNYMSPGAGEDGGYINSQYMSPVAGDEFMSPDGHDDDEGEYLSAGKHSTNDEYVLTDGEVMSHAANSNDDDDDDGGGGYDGRIAGSGSTFGFHERGALGSYQQTQRIPNLSGNYHQTLRAAHFALPSDGGRALPMNPLSLTARLPNFDYISNNLHTGITGGLAGISTTEMDWVSAQWDRANTSTFEVEAGNSNGSGSNAVKSNPLFEDLSDLSDQTAET